LTTSALDDHAGAFFLKQISFVNNDYQRSIKKGQIL